MLLDHGVIALNFLGQLILDKKSQEILVLLFTCDTIVGQEACYTIIIVE
jgi:hypothetical protein